MPSAPGQKGDKPSKQLAAIDRLLIAGIKQGPAKKRDAINRILELVPEWTRGDCWRRIKKLRRAAKRAVLEERPAAKAKKSGEADRSPTASFQAMDAGGLRQVVEPGWVRTSQKDCSAPGPFGPRGPLPDGGTRNECESH